MNAGIDETWRSVLFHSTPGGLRFLYRVILKINRKASLLLIEISSHLVVAEYEGVLVYFTMTA